MTREAGDSWNKSKSLKHKLPVSSIFLLCRLLVNKLNELFTAMTNYEIDKKKMNQEALLNDVAEKRSNLTMILLDLMEQQVVIIVIKKSIILFT
jgi:hypothetical protein